MQWLDVAKGIGIVLVVFGHALGGIVDSPAGAHAIGLRTVFLAIYVFHMPLFFVLAGLLVQARLARSRHKFAIDLIQSIAIPYFLWSIIQFSTIYAAGSLVNRPVETWWPTILALPWRTVSQFWFLWVLFVLHGAALLIVPRIGAASFLVAALAARLAVPYVPIHGMAHLAIVQAPFYALGVAVAAQGVDTLLVRRSLLVRAALLPVAAMFALACATMLIGRQPGFAVLASPDIQAIAWRWQAAPATLLAIAAILGLSATIVGRPAAVLAYLGQATMTIYVLHILFIAGTRIALGRIAHLHDPIVLLPTVCFVGIAGPLIVRALARRAGVPKVLGLG